MVAPASLAALVVLGAIGDLDLQPSARFTSDVRSNSTVGQDNTAFGTLSLYPRLMLLSRGPLHFELTYEPAYLVPVNVTAGAPELRSLQTIGDNGSLLHQLSFAIVSTEPGLRMRGAVDAVRGSMLQRAALGQAGVARVVPQPATGTPSAGGATSGGTSPNATPGAQVGTRLGTQPDLDLGFAGWRVGGELEKSLDGATRLQLRAGGAVTGGATTEDRLTLPMQRELVFDGAMRWRVDRRDSVAAVLGGTASRVDRGSDAVFVRAGAELTRSLTRELIFNAAAGPAGTWVRPGETSPPPRSEDPPKAVPWARLSLGYASAGLRPFLAAGANLEPVIDRLTGSIDMQAGLEVRADWTPLQAWTFGARIFGGGIWSWEEFDRLATAQLAETRLALAELRVTHRFGEAVSLSVVGAQSVQKSRLETIPTYREVAGALELSVTP